MLNELLIIGFLTLYNFSIATTEAWKWRQDMGKPDNHCLIDYDSYHAWRSVTSAGVLATCFVATKDPVPVVLGWTGSTILYERTISFVQYDDWSKKRGPFHILKWDIPRPPVWCEWTLMGACYVGGVLYIAHGN